MAAEKDRPLPGLVPRRAEAPENNLPPRADSGGVPARRASGWILLSDQTVLNKQVPTPPNVPAQTPELLVQQAGRPDSHGRGQPGRQGSG